MGLAGGALLFGADRGRLWAKAEGLSSSAAETVADYWRLVQNGFRLEPGLVYLNNASLGPSPELVADATEAFRRRLDAFPRAICGEGGRRTRRRFDRSALPFLGPMPRRSPSSTTPPRA